MGLKRIFYFYPNNKDTLLSILKSEQLNCRIYIDSSDEINKLNQFNNDHMFQCFLLDKNNKVLLMGNPANNHKIWELYHNTITGETKTKASLTTVETSQFEIELQDLKAGKTSEAIFQQNGYGPL